MKKEKEPHVVYYVRKRGPKTKNFSPRLRSQTTQKVLLINEPNSHQQECTCGAVVHCFSSWTQRHRTRTYVWGVSTLVLLRSSEQKITI